MDVISLVLIMLVAVVASGIVSRLVPFPVPLPLVQIALGFLIAATTQFEIELEPHVFFYLFIPPLLFLDGWRIPKEGFFRDAGTILELALGLVFLTVVGAGFFIHWLIPELPLAVAFALAAVLSPTDPVAVSAIAARVPIPKRVMHILEGESLLNDGSGLVAMRFALAAALTGTFSLPEAAATFLWVAIGGLAIGAGFTWAVTQVKTWFGRRFGEETGAQILVSLLIPFGAYLLAEQVHASGILAAVAAGITMGFVEFRGAVRGETRVQREAVWNTVQFAANGAIFVLLGEQLPGILTEAQAHEGVGDLWRIAGYVVAISAALIVLRFVWVWTSLRFTMYRARQRGLPGVHPPLRLIAAVSVAGVRGAITLAGVLTFPLALDDGTPFPGRDLAISIAAGVIILSLVTASLALPRLLKNLAVPPKQAGEDAEERVRRAAAEAAVRAVEKAEHEMAQGRDDAELFTAAATEVLHSYRYRLRGGSDALAAHADPTSIERQLALIAVRAERDEVFRQARERALDDAIARAIIRDLDLAESRLGAPKH